MRWIQAQCVIITGHIPLQCLRHVFEFFDIGRSRFAVFRLTKSPYFVKLAAYIDIAQLVK